MSSPSSQVSGYVFRFLVRNIHCNTCVSYAVDVLGHHVRPEAIRVSIINHTIEVTSTQNTGVVMEMRQDLHNAGFDVQHISVVDRSTDMEIEAHPAALSKSTLLDRMFKKRLSVSQAQKRHASNCDACQAQAEAPPRSRFWSTLLGRDGQKIPPPRSSSTGNVIAQEKTSRRVSTRGTECRPSQAGLHHVELSIGGMTCASCTSSVTDALQQIEGVESVSVNLMTSIARVTYYGLASKAQELAKEIEEIGFEATVEDVQLDNSRYSAIVSEDGRTSQTVRERVVQIQVTGMYCHRCPDIIEEMLLREFPNRLAITRRLTLDQPRMTVAYTPSLPVLTVRRIIGMIEALDNSFKAKVHRPKSTEQRSREISHKEQNRILRRLFLALISAIPSFVLGVVYMSLVPEHNQTRVWLETPIWAGQAMRVEWALLIITTPVFLYGGSFFHTKAIREIWSLWRPRSKTPVLKRLYRFGSMNLLISAGTSIAYFASVAVLIMDAVATDNSDAQATTRKASTYFDTATFLIFFILIGKFLEAYSKSQSGDAVSMLQDLRPQSALILKDKMQASSDSDDDVYLQVATALLEIGDVVCIPHGASPPTDGTVFGEGRFVFDESSLTGESSPVVKKAGDRIFTGSLNLSDSVHMCVTDIDGNTILDRIVHTVREGQAKRAPIERFADIITGYFTPVITLIAIMTWIIWLSLGQSGSLPESWLDTAKGGWPFWSLEFAIAVFVVACPCGIGLAAPTALFVGGSLAAKKGILVQGGGQAFQEASSLDAIVFDKTGTLTEGQMQVTESEVLEHSFAEERLTHEVVLAIAKTLEEQSSHPIACSIVRYCGDRLKNSRVSIQMTDVKELPGKGMTGTMQIRSGPSDAELIDVLIGNEALLMERSATDADEQSSSYQSTLHKYQSAGCSTAILAVRRTSDRSVRGTSSYTPAAIFAITDPLRLNAVQVLDSLRQRGIAVYMCTGDNARTARAISSQLGIPATNVRADVLPQEKASFIYEIQHPVALEANPTSSVFLSRVSQASSKPRQGRQIVAFAGDGTNDAPALTVADVSIAISHPSCSDIALTSSSFILLSPQLESILTLVTLSKRVFRRVKINFFWAGIYNIVLIPIAAGVFFPVGASWDKPPSMNAGAIHNGMNSGMNGNMNSSGGGGGGFRLSPVWASLAMAASSISVILSSLALRWEFTWEWKRKRTSNSL